MALTKCKECGNEISTKADACPKCGAKPQKTSGCAVIVLLFFGFILFSAIVGQCSNSSRTSNSPAITTTSSLVSTPKPAIVEPTPKPPVIGSQWNYTRDEDPMGKGTTYVATVVSSNTVEFEFPYSGQQHARLFLRTHPRHGKDVIFQIERGQILCRSYEDCEILIRFDDGNAETFSAVGPADNSSESAFLRNYSRFVEKMMKAKRVRIAAPIYQQGSPVFEFDVSGFDIKKYKSEK